MLKIKIPAKSSLPVRDTSIPPEDATPLEIIKMYPPQPPVPDLNSADLDLFAAFNLYPHIMHGKFYRQSGKGIRTNLKKYLDKVQGPEIEPIGDREHKLTGVIHHKDASLFPLINKPVPDSYTIDPKISKQHMDTALRFNNENGPLNIIPAPKSIRERNKN